MNNDTKKIVISSLFWKLLERIGVQGIQLIITIVLARMLMPSDYGVIALLSIFINLSNVIVQRGFTSALIQRKNVGEVDFSTVFFISLIGSVLLYSILYFTAPFIADFFNHPELSNVLRVLALSLPFSAINSVQIAIVSRAMQFRKLFKSSIGSIVCSGTIGILMAFLGFGVWALVAQQISFAVVNCFFMALVEKWRPKLLFSFNKAKGLFSYGWKMLLTSLIDTLYIEINTILIGKIFNTQMLGFYNKGKQIPGMLVTSLNGSIQSVMFSAFSRYQDDRLLLKNMMRRSVVTSSFIIFPMMAGLAAMASPLVELILTDVWRGSVVFIQLFCAYFALYPIHTSNLQAISAIGRSDIYLKLEIVKKLVGIIVLILAIPHGIYAIAVGGIITSVIGAIINMYPNIKLLQYPIREQILDILPSFLLAITMGLIVYSILLIKLPIVVTIIMQVIVGTLFYFGMAILFKFECLTYILKILGKNK